MPRNNKRHRNNHNNNRKKVKQLNNDGCGVTIGRQPTNVFAVGTEQSIELAANQTEMGSDNSKIDCIVVLANDTIEKSENKNELSENENKIEIDEANMSNETDVGVDEKCDDQNRVINQSDKDSEATCQNNITGIIERNEQCNNLAYNQNTTVGACGDVNSFHEPKSTNKSKIPKAVIANCFTYDSCTETPPPQVTSNVDRENAQVKFNEKCFGSIPNDTNISEDKTFSDFDKTLEPKLVMCDKIAFNPIMQEITNNSDYRVDSPSAMTVEKPKLVGVKKSRSMDDNEVMIQEMSDTGSIGDNENTPIVSEAESEVESDIFEISPSPSGVLVSVQTIPFSGPLVDLSKEEEELIQNLINDPKTGNLNDTKIQKIKKRSALENHFMPQFLNPKFLDVIKEETSDTSDVEKPATKNRGNSFDDELDDDVFLDNNSIVQKTNAVFPKINLNFSGRRKHVSHLKSPSADVIREEPQCFLVDAKIVDPESIEESCSKWTTSVVKQEPIAELVYIGSSSSSDANDQDSVGEADVEDSCDEDSDVRIKTPIIGMIGCDDQNFSSIDDSGFKSLLRSPTSKSESSLVANDIQVVGNDQYQCERKDIYDLAVPVPDEVETDIGLPVVNECHNEKIDYCDSSVTEGVEKDIVLSVVSKDDCRNETSENGDSLVPDEVKNFAIQVVGSFECVSERNDIFESSIPNEVDKNITMPVVSKDNGQSEIKNIHSSSATADEVEKSIDKICDFVTNNTETNDPNDPIPKFKIGAPSEILTIYGAPCSNNMFPIIPVNPNSLNDLPVNEFIRQDSSGSICSSLSHSTSQSQSTARFCATSPPRDIADFESCQCISGASSLTTSLALQSIKTLRQIALETLVSLPYGSVVLEELAIVAESLSHLTNQPCVELSPPPIPPKPQSFIEDSPPPVPPKPVQNHLESPPPPPIPPKPTNMPYPLPDIPFIDDLELPESMYSNSAREIKIVQLPPTTYTQPIMTQSRTNSWLGMPTEQNPSVLLCLSPSQRNFFKDNKHPNEINPDLLLEMHNTFVKRRGYHEYTDIELRELNREKHLLNDDRHNEMVAKNDDNNRLLAIIRDSKQSTGENSAAHNVECDRTFEHNNQSGDKMSSFPSADGNLKMNKSSVERSLLDNSRTMTQPVRMVENIEKSTYETKKRIENGNVVFEFSNSTKEKSTNGNKECIKELNVTGDSANPAMMKSDINLEKKSFSNANNKIPSSPINNSAGSTENTKLKEKSTNQQEQQQRNIKAKSEHFDDKITFKEFDFIPKFFDDCFHTEADRNNFFNTQNSNNERFFEREENHYRSSVTSPRPQSSLQDWLKEIDEANNSLDNIVKPIVREENLCKGMGSKVNIRAPRIHTIESSNEINDKFDEAQRRYEMYVTKQNHIFNRQSMIDTTPITPHVTQRRKSLPKELQQKQLEYIRKKEEELNYEFDKLEHDRMRLLQEIEEMKVNQHVKDFVNAHKLNYNSSNFISRHQSEAELLRQQMHDEWLNKVAEREERRLQKIIKITRPGEENATPEQKPRNSSADIEHEFLNRVKERRTKLKMPSDSDWESGAESQPIEREKKEKQVDPKIKVIEGERETDLKELPKHIKEFASDFTISTERTDTSVKEITESRYEMKSSSTTTTNDGIWSPGTKTETSSILNRQNSSTSQPPTPPPAPFWSPKSAEPSPTFDRKEFRPVKFESPQLSRKVYTKEEPPVQSPWSYPLPDKVIPPRNIPIANFNYSSPYTSNISKTQNNTITLLQKAKENQLPRSGITNYMQTERKQISQNHSPGIIRPNEVFHSIKNEYLSEQESENERPKKMVDLGHKKIEGIGPTTKQGMPIVLRSEVDEDNHHKWYKKMYNTLHKVHQNDSYDLWLLFSNCSDKIIELDFTIEVTNDDVDANSTLLGCDLGNIM